MKNIIRDLKIDKISGTQNEIEEEFNRIWKSLKSINCYAYFLDKQEVIYYNQDNRCVFYRYDPYQHFYISDDLYLKVFKSKFGLNDIEIEQLTKFFVEEKLGIKIKTPMVGYLFKDSFDYVDKILSKKLRPRFRFLFWISKLFK